MAKDLAIVLNNGSLNSCVTTALAGQKYRPILLYVELTTSPATRMRAAYDQQVAFFKPYREHTLPMAFLPPPSTEPSLDPRQGGALPQQLLHLLPLLTAAAPFASQYQASAIYCGLRVGPGGDELAAATEYIQILNELVQLPCGLKDLEIVAPLLELDLWQVVDVAYQVSAPLERGWSCLEETTDPCGVVPRLPRARRGVSPGRESGPTAGDEAVSVGFRVRSSGFGLRFRAQSR